MSTDRAFVRWRAWYWSRMHCLIPLWGAVAPPVCQGGCGVPRQAVWGVLSQCPLQHAHTDTRASARPRPRAPSARNHPHARTSQVHVPVPHTHTRTERERDLIRTHRHVRHMCMHSCTSCTMPVSTNASHTACKATRQPRTTMPKQSQTTTPNNHPQQAMPPLQCPRGCTEAEG